MNIEDSLLKDEQERTLTWAIQNLEKQKEEIDGQISQTSGEVQNIQSQLDKVATLLQGMKEKRNEVENKIDMANKRMATLENEPVSIRSQLQQNLMDLDSPELDEPQEERSTSAAQQTMAFDNPQVVNESGNAYSTLNIRCRANTLELLRQISLRTGVSENTIMENAVAAVAKAIQQNDFRMHFPLSVQLVQE